MRLATVVAIASLGSSLFMDALVLTVLPSRKPGERWSHSWDARDRRGQSCRRWAGRGTAGTGQGRGGRGTGGTPQMAGEQGGSGGVGMRNSFPWVEAEPPDMHWPVKVSMLG